MTRVHDGDVLYRLEFVGRPDLNRENFVSKRPYNIGDPFDVVELDDNWVVVEVLHAQDGERDTLQLTIQEAV